MSLRWKIALANAAFFLAAIALFGGLQVANAERTVEALIDDALMGRARDMVRGPRPGQGPPPGQQQGGPEGGPPGFQQTQNAPQGGNPPGGQGQGRGPGLGGPNGQGMRRAGPPPTPFRRMTLYTADGMRFPPNADNDPWDQKLLDASFTGKLGKSYVVLQGQKLRVVSIPFPREDGRYDVVQAAQEADAVDLARRAQLTNLLSALPLVALAAVGLAALLSRFVLKPVGQLTTLAERIKGYPGSKERIPVESNDEMGRLSATFNEMTDRMQDANAELAISLERQRRFTSDAAHEFRTPLTSISLAAENGLHDDATLEDMRKSLQTISRASGSLTKMTELLLSLSRLDSAETAITVEPCSLRPLVEDAAQLSRVADDSRLAIDIDPDAPRVLASPDAVRQIVSNLLRNAAAHTMENGAILVRQTGSRLAISDNGEGIGAEHLPKLFDRFYRVDTARAKASGGHGLGLAIVKSLCEAQGATISVESKLGQGSTFFIDFRPAP